MEKINRSLPSRFVYADALCSTCTAVELDDATKDNISQSLTSFLETMNNMSREEMEAQIEGFDSVFFKHNG